MTEESNSGIKIPADTIGRPKYVNQAVALILASLLVGCGGGGGSGSPGSAAASCGPYPEQTTSLYILPYEVGTGHRMVHGNCTAPGTSHQAGGTRQYAYDFEMPIGNRWVTKKADITMLSWPMARLRHGHVVTY